LSPSTDLSYVSPKFRDSASVTNAFHGSAGDQLMLANCFLEGTNGFPRDPKRGVYWLTQSVNGGDICALNQLGLCYLGGDGVMKDDILGFKLIKLAAEKGFVVAMLNVALLASNGKGTPVNYALAAEYLKLASDQGNVEAGYQLGQFYKYGWGVPQDKALAFQYFQNASREGHSNARASLALCYEEGIGTEVDFQTARKYWLHAALNNDAIAARNVGERFLAGTAGFPVDLVKARRYLLRGAEGGDAQAQYQVSKCFTQGIGGPDNAAIGLKWLEKAAAQEYPEAVAEVQANRQQEEQVLAFNEMMANLQRTKENVDADSMESGRYKDQSKRKSLIKRIFRGKPGGAGH